MCSLSRGRAARCRPWVVWLRLPVRCPAGILRPSFMLQFLIRRGGGGDEEGKARPRDPLLTPSRSPQGSVDCPNLEFEYGDADDHSAELAELYSYTEEPELSHNRRCFEEDFHTQVPGRRWLELDRAQQKAYVMRLLDGLEVVNRDKRLRVARAILYLAQGVFGDCDNEGDVLHWSRHNSFLLYQLGTFSAFLELLNMEIENSQACSSALRKPAISLADSTELRVLLSVMYLMVENIRVEQETDPPEWKTCRETFRMELSFPVHTEEPFALLLFTMVTKFCSGHAPHFPMKKVLLLLWKVLLFTLGGFQALQAMKVRRREELGLPPLPEDSIQVVRGMRAASPPTYAIELVEQQQQQQQKQRSHRSRRPLMKQDSLDIYNERDLFKNDEGGVDEEENEDVDSGIEGELDLMERDTIIPAMPAQRLPIERVSFPKGLPWAPKVSLGEELSSTSPSGDLILDIPGFTGRRLCCGAVEQGQLSQPGPSGSW
uniref:Striatin interacting protein 2 n=1 Tax=Taeniopygia guttata TaxID=59729 RepID=H0YUG6_TAEGU